MAESERERKKREKQESIDRINREERERKQQEREQRMWDEAHEAEVAKGSDASFEKDFKAEFGFDFQEMNKNLNAAINDSQLAKDFDVVAAQKAIQEGLQAAKGGFFSSGNARKARKILKKNKDKIKKANKKGKKKRGWFS